MKKLTEEYMKEEYPKKLVYVKRENHIEGVIQWDNEWGKWFFMDNHGGEHFESDEFLECCCALISVGYTLYENT